MNTLPAMAQPATQGETPLTLPNGERLDAPGLPLAPTSDTEPGGPAVSPATAGKTPAEAAVTEDLTLAQMGQRRAMTLQGNQALSGVSFSLPQDLVVEQAQLKLMVSASPALAQRGEMLFMMLNGQPMGTLPLGQDAGGENTYQLDIPAAMLTGQNNLSFRVGQSDQPAEGQCLAPLDKGLSVSISPASALQYRGVWLNGGRNLRRFPLPFFDPRSMTGTSLPLMLAADPQASEITAAAIIASGLGSLSGNSAVDLPVLLDQLPAGNGIIIGRSGQTVAGVVLPGGDGPQLTIIDNPSAPTFKLLVVSGDDEAQLRQAAWDLSTAPLPEGPQWRVPMNGIAQRHDYDAPAWLSADGPVPLRRLAAAEGALSAKGLYHGANNLTFRVAPDLFWWDGATLPMNLSYVFASGEGIDTADSSLTVSLNGRFLGRLTPRNAEPERIIRRWLGLNQPMRHASLYLDPAGIYSQNQLGFYFDLRPDKAKGCLPQAGANLISRIDPDSTLNFPHNRHFALMPNLAYFAGAAFPFSRRADFAETTLLLPANPDVNELYTLINLMVRAGKATGLAAGHVKVRLGMPADGDIDHDDILVVSDLGQDSPLPGLMTGSAFDIDGGGLTVRPPSNAIRLRSWLNGDAMPQDAAARAYLAGAGDWRGLLSFRSPWDPGRVVVAVAAKDTRQLPRLIRDLNDPSVNAAIHGDLSIISGKGEVSSFQVSDRFASGDMPLYLRIFWYAARHVVAVALLIFALSLFLGLTAYGRLRRRAEQRLGDSDRETGNDDTHAGA
ncbi:cellulose biosynthesis cyclic di-GMP-binding regulatory protein BcsB [Martelella alba]|uniref:cellulose biosynthesis cyclic di-GMP-binding regulatory protein BcsB n=1 Tax=Martelella alba TaxID=2590451 RepID=UPI001485352B|nr:cellulose biosynthesis cyclic di-GMP-binding regulatory protein BcsB [Martelella alba]